MRTDSRSNRLCTCVANILDSYVMYPPAYWDYCGIIEQPSFSNRRSTHRFRLHQDLETHASSIITEIENVLKNEFRGEEWFSVSGSDYVSNAYLNGGYFERQITIDIIFQNHDLGFMNDYDQNIQEELNDDDLMMTDDSPLKSSFDEDDGLSNLFNRLNLHLDY